MRKCRRWLGPWLRLLITVAVHLWSLPLRVRVPCLRRYRTHSPRSLEVDGLHSNILGLVPVVDAAAGLLADKRRPPAAHGPLRSADLGAALDRPVSVDNIAAALVAAAGHSSAAHRPPLRRHYHHCTSNRRPKTVGIVAAAAGRRRSDSSRVAGAHLHPRSAARNAEPAAAAAAEAAAENRPDAAEIAAAAAAAAGNRPTVAADGGGAVVGGDAADTPLVGPVGGGDNR
jgi:hypothetical protein